MAFFIKNFESITASLILRVSENTAALTDFNVGSKIRTLLEAFAEELEYFYLDMYRGIIEGINNAVYNSFDFPPLPPVSASGVVNFSLVQAGTTVPLAPTSSFSIPSGFQVQVPVQTTASISNKVAPSGTVYQVLNDTVWNAGATSVSATVVCTSSGIVGNTIANSVTGIVGALPTVQGGTFLVTNTIPFTNGEDQETNEERKARFSKYLQSLGRGTLVSLEFAALQAVVNDAVTGNIKEQVKKAVAVEPYKLDGSKPPAHCDIYIHNGVGGTSSSLVSAAQKVIDGYTDTNNNRISGYKAAGIIATVLPAVENPISFIIQVTMKPSFSLTNDLKSEISGFLSKYVDTLNPGERLVYNKVIDLVMDADGVYNCLILSPAGDIVPSGVQVINTVNSINITENTAFTISGIEPSTSP
jgi:hypothetical protein